MMQIKQEDISQYVEENIGIFHQKRIQSLDKLELNKVLKRKNPYLFKAKYVQTAEQIVRGIVDAHISSYEETIFGDWLEGLAIFINSKIFGGYKSGIRGIDLEFSKEAVRYIVSIKSGPNWGNSSQIAKMKADFNTARKILRTSNSNLNVIAVNGCCYGRDSKPDKGDYFKYCGQNFWEFISGDKNLYTEIIEPLGYKAKEKNDIFAESYTMMINRFTKEFAKAYIGKKGEINWEELIRFNSGV
jgi:hypothetical protein